ncbi:MAG: NADH-quinone oxidoreductase subunit A [Ignavibacteriae bacterium]|nr:NADH-quinone oxidoreductase subunit A [Ignavibacteria bacterium]MBI3363956.1 NADH-quinone oxidoreductase subunit A [Ignavibacteriota bacterium]
MLTEFGRVFIFFLVGAIFVAGGLITAWLIRPHRWYPNKLTSYECGEEPVGDSWVKFNIRFYVVALIFLIFDVEVVFLFPWALVYQKLGAFAFIEMLIFLAILGVGYAYVWVKGDLDWDKPQPTIPHIMKTPAPVSPEYAKEEVIA